MSAHGSGTDMGFGLAVVFGALSVLGALAATATSYLALVDGSYEMQLFSGVGIGLAMLFAGLAVAALHLYGD